MGKGLPDRIIAIITSRWNSTRLPGKALIDIGGKPLLQHIVDNARNVGCIEDVVVATTQTSEPIIDYCNVNQISWYVYPNDWDVLERLYETAKVWKADIIVYLWGDCPLIQPEDIEDAVKYFLNVQPSYLSYATQYGFIGVVSMTELSIARNAVNNAHNREYIHEYLGRQKRAIKQGKCVKCEKFPSCVSINKPISVDTPEDLGKVRRIYETYRRRITRED